MNLSVRGADALLSARSVLIDKPIIKINGIDTRKFYCPTTSGLTTGKGREIRYDTLHRHVRASALVQGMLVVVMMMISGVARAARPQTIADVQCIVVVGCIQIQIRPTGGLKTIQDRLQPAETIKTPIPHKATCLSRRRLSRQ